VGTLDVDSAERLALRELVERYAQSVDARDVDGVTHLFTEDGAMLSHLFPGTEETPYERVGHTKIHRALELGLAQYLATTHMIGAHVVELDGAEGDGVVVCMAHHVYDDPEGAGRRLLVMAIRYEDRYAKEHGMWRFAERRLRLLWREDRPLADGR